MPLDPPFDNPIVPPKGKTPTTLKDAAAHIMKLPKAKQQLIHRYSTAKVIQFSGPTGEWVRVRVPQDDKRQAQQVADNTHTSAPVWLVRMD